MIAPGLTEVHVRGFRSIREAEFRPGRVSALIGEPSAGKSNLLSAIRALLDPEAAPLVASDLTSGTGGPIRIDGILAGGSELTVARPRTGSADDIRSDRPPVLYLPAALRSGRVLAPSTRRPPEVRRAEELLGRSIPGLSGEADADGPVGAATEAARGLVGGIEACRDAGVNGVVVLIEEPELFLPPQTQRYLYRLLRQLAWRGNQVLYSTLSPAFLNVARLDELVFTERADDGTRLLQPEPLAADEEFRAASEFDAARSELFLARAAVLVEGLTELLALPFVFTAMGYDADRERISIVESGGKANVLLIARISRAAGIPFLAVHDRDAEPGRPPSEAERHLNELIAEVAGEDRIELAPDFEGVAGLRGRRHKPARAWHSFADLHRDEVPEPLGRLVERAIELARR